MDPTSASVAAQEDGKSREQILSQAAEAVTRSQNPQLSTSHVFPEGGAEAWAVVFGAWCAMLPPLGLVNSIAVLQGWLSSHELSGISESKIGWIFSCYAFFITAGGAFVGKFSQREPDIARPKARVLTPAQALLLMLMIHT